jgi:hypothetical protein
MTRTETTFEQVELTINQLDQVVGGDSYMHNPTNSERGSGGGGGSAPLPSPPIYEKTLALLHGAMGA